jgi:hypothetical protein
MGLKQSFVDKYLDPGDSLGEILFGLIMVLTFTLGAGLTVSEGREATRTLLIAALGCNVAWGIIDGLMYVMGCMFERGRQARFIRMVRKTPDAEHAIALFRRELDPKLEEVTTEEARARLYADMVATVKRAELSPTKITKEDVYGGIASFVLVFLTTIPAVLPFLFIDDLHRALRTSNFLLIGLLFLAGWRWARETTANPWIVGTTIMAFGTLLVVVAVALGG